MPDFCRKIAAIDGQPCYRYATMFMALFHVGISMITKIMPALCAALLLAACGSSGENTEQPVVPVNTAQLPDNGTGNDTGTGIDQQGLTPGSAQEFEKKVGNTVHFDTDSYSLNAEAQAALQQQAAWLKQYPEHMVTVEGHADERGTREYNLALGDRRATTVLNYLTALGIDKARLSEVSYGKEKPVCPDASDACWGENRRGVTALSN
jgi:peptidoglycan-associated lipoprotein